MYKKNLLYWDVRPDNILYRKRLWGYEYTLGDLGSVVRSSESHPPPSGY